MKNKKAKKALTVAMTALLVLCVGYFAALPPTSAWFYQRHEGTEKTFIFGRLELGEDFTAEETIDLPAATKLEDPGEILFDDVLHIVEVECQNTGSLPARVYTTVNGNTALPNGLRFFFYEDGDTGAALKDKVAGKSVITENDAAATYAALDNYNKGAGGNDAGRYILVMPGETKIARIAFWADYNVVGSTLENTSNVSEHYTYGPFEIIMHAVQHTDGAFTR